MKKIVVVIILATCILSVAVVNFFGLEIKQYAGETYIKSIEVSDVVFLGNDGESVPATSVKRDKDGNIEYISYVFDYIPPEEGTEYTPEDVDNRNMIRLDFILTSEKGEILPYSDGMVNLVYSLDSGVAFFHDGTGSFVFLKPNKMLRIALKSTDGHGAETVVYIGARYPS